MKITTREATPEDIETLLLFEQGVIDAERPMDITLKRDKTHYYDLPFMMEEPNIHFIVAEVADELIGCGYARIIKAREYFQFDRFSYLGFMYTKPEFRGKGVNKIIMDHLYEWSKSQGIYEVRLEVYPNNPAAIRAYEKAGMTQNLITMRVELNKD
jgi:GNAT superfamily N-acetyltransferase